MSFFDAISIASSGLAAESLRMDVTSENLANAQTTRAAAGGPYQRQEVVLQSVPSSFNTALSAAMGTGTGAAIDGTSAPGGVKVTGVVNDPTPDKLVYDPGNPDANKQGYVQMPNVNTVTEMTDLIDESRSYESDVTAMQTAKTMVSQTFNLLK
jgi:flagellar basal-body rod protein FlgC